MTEDDNDHYKQGKKERKSNLIIICTSLNDKQGKVRCMVAGEGGMRIVSFFPLLTNTTVHIAHPLPFLPLFSITAPAMNLFLSLPHYKYIQPLSPRLLLTL